MNKKVLFFGLSVFALAFSVTASTLVNQTNSAKAATDSVETAYGSWDRNEELGTEVRQGEGWWKAHKDSSFTVNGVTWNFNYGRVRNGASGYDSFALLSYGKEADGTLYTNSILDPTVYDRDTSVFGKLAASLIANETTSGTIDENGNYAAVSAVYNETPVVLTDDITIFAGARENWAFAYIRAVDADVMYDTDEDGTNESVLVSKDTWYPLYRADGEKAAYSASNHGVGSGVNGQYDQDVFKFGSGYDGTWRFNYFKGHEVQVAFGTIAGVNPNLPAESSVATYLNGIVINDGLATANMMQTFAARNPEGSGGFCSWIGTTDNYFGITLRQTQQFLDEKDLELLSSTAINSEFTSYTTALSLLNYLNEVAGIAQYQTQITSLIGNNPYTLVVMVLILTMTLAAIGLIVYKRRKIKA